MAVSIEKTLQKGKHTVWLRWVLTRPVLIPLDGPPEFRQSFNVKAVALCLFLTFAGMGVAWTADADYAKADTTLCGSYPKLYKEIIWNWLQKSLVDANSARIEWQGDPQCVDFGTKDKHNYGWLVNFTINSRNRFGAYTGKQKHGALIQNGEVVKGIGFGY